MHEKRLKTDYSFRDFYNYYNEKSKYKLEYKKCKLFIDLFFLKVIDEIIFNNYLYKLPKSLGLIAIYKRKSNFRNDESLKTFAVDYKKTKKLWEENPEAKKRKILVRHLNRHTNGYLMSINYTKNKAKYKNQTIYKFRPERYNFTRKLAKALKDESLKLDYYEKT
jgi:hypothetical protein